MLERMISPRATPAESRRTPEVSALRWWFRPSAGILWRLPLLAILAMLLAWFAFRGLVHLSFLFVAHPAGTFLFAPALLPFAFLPAICFLLGIRLIPRVWRPGAYSSGQRVAFTGLGPLVAFVAAQTLDLVQINLVRLMGIRLPRLPFDPT